MPQTVPKKEVGKMWIGLNCLRMGSSFGLLSCLRTVGSHTEFYSSTKKYVLLKVSR
jgi:hypothetical protein